MGLSGLLNLGSLSGLDLDTVGASESPSDLASYNAAKVSALQDAIGQFQQIQPGQPSYNYAQTQIANAQKALSALGAPSQPVSLTPAQTAQAVGTGIAASGIPGASMIGATVSTAGQNLLNLTGRSLGSYVAIGVGIGMILIGLLMFKQTQTVIAGAGRGAARVAEAVG